MIACGEDSNQTEGDLGPVALSVASAVETVEEGRVVASFQASSELLKEWRFRDAETSFSEGARGASLLIEHSTPRCAVEIPVQLEAGTVNQVVVHLEHNGPTDLFVCFKAKGKRQFVSETIRQPTRREPTPVLLDTAGALSLSEGTDTIEIVLGNRNNRVSLHGVDLLWVPPGTYLPTPTETPSVGGPVRLGGEYRLALCIKPGQPVSGHARIPSGAELRYAFGVPKIARFAGLDGRLDVTVRAEGREPAGYSIQLNSDEEDGFTWVDRRLDLSALAGREAKFEFEFSSGGSTDGMLALATPRIIRPTPDARHVVLITSDTHRGDHLGVAGEGVEIRTPFLDSLAESGVFFEDCFSTSNLTLPSHAAIMTGLSPREVGIIDNITALSEEAHTLAEAFREAGYFTASVLSTKHLSHENSGLAQGFDRVVTTRQAKQVGQVSVEAVQALFQEEGDQPVFLWLHVFDAHAPYLPPDEYRHEYYPQDRDPYEQRSGITDGNRAAWDKRIVDLEFILSQYKSEITYLDAMLAEVFDAPRFEDSIIAFTADHGESLGGHGIFFKHLGVYPDTINVPLLLRWPGCPSGTRVKAPVQNNDVGRTLLDLAGLGTVEFPGESLLTKLDSGHERAPRFVLGSHGHHASVEQDGWLCVLTIHATVDFPGAPRHKVELYDLSTDPACEHDQIEVEFERAKVMRRGLISWLAADRRADLAVIRDQKSVELLEAIAALGYTTEASGDDGPYYLEDPEDEWCKRFR